MIWVGTSGYNYPEWKGSFYPEKIPSAKMLPYYAERLPTVEINYTFYRAPTARILEGWAAATPEAFTLTLKASRRITHDQRLRDCAEPVGEFFEMARVLGPKLGAVLFQLPPFLKKDLPLDPWGKTYLYKIPGEKGDFDLVSYGKDGVPGGTGESADLRNN